ncbi:MAG: 4Fe-4S binding protein, partial [Planctomycetota bacterium]
LLWSLIILIPTLFLGRFFCNWVCPFGILHHFVGWRFNARSVKQRIESNRYRRMYAIKYYILAATLIAAVFGSLQIGLLDPISTLHRSLAASILPALNMPPSMVEVYGDPKLHQLGWVIGFIVLILVGLNLVIPRFFCRVLCPLGALLGLLSRFSLWRIERDIEKCTDCDLCLQSCEGACDPHTRLRKSECLVCFNCIEDCPSDALSFAFLPDGRHEVTWPDAPRRKLLFAAVVGALFYPFARLSGKSTRNFSSKAIRPPGTVEELEFLERCIKCSQCIRVCPTNVLQPAFTEAGIEGLWTPVMNFRMGHCQLNCTACGHVCPTGAIQQISVEEKLGEPPYEDQGPVKLGIAHFDLGRCLPWSKNIPCVVCEEVCPTSPKAIHTEYRKIPVRDGKKQVLSSTPTTVKLADYPAPGEAVGEPCSFGLNEFQSDQTTGYYVRIVHGDGSSETHRILSNDGDSVIIGEQDSSNSKLVNGTKFGRLPARGDVVEIQIELKSPKIDTELCIGCGICEKECPVVGDRRAVYVTAEGETRSQHRSQADRNRSLRLVK